VDECKPLPVTLVSPSSASLTSLKCASAKLPLRIHMILENFAGIRISVWEASLFSTCGGGGQVRRRQRRRAGTAAAAGAAATAGTAERWSGDGVSACALCDVLT